MLCVDLNQIVSLLLLFRSWVHLERQVEYKFTKVALVITQHVVQKEWQQLWKQLWNPGAFCCMHRLHMFTKDRWMECASTNQTHSAKKMTNTAVQPKFSKSSFSQDLKNGFNCGMSLNACKETFSLNDVKSPRQEAV